MEQKPALLQLDSSAASEYQVYSVAFARRKLLTSLLAEVGACISSPHAATC